MINIKNVAGKIDHAVLKPTDGKKELIEACIIAKKYNVASICVKPCDVRQAVLEMQNSGVPVCTVIGFPHGANTIGTKLAEAEEAIKSGAKEIDMVINIAKLKEKDENYLVQEIEAASILAHKNNCTIKIIIEASLLTDDEKILACKVVEAGGAEYIKTSTGFANGGATIEDITLIKSTIDSKIKVKASGGIKTLEQAMGFINLGCDRLGTSQTENIIHGKETAGEY